MKDTRVSSEHAQPRHLIVHRTKQLGLTSYRIAELGREMHSKQEDYDKETKHNRQELAEKEKT